MKVVRRKKLSDYVKMYGLLIETYTGKADVNMDFVKGTSAVVRSDDRLGVSESIE